MNDFELTDSNSGDSDLGYPPKEPPRTNYPAILAALASTTRPSSPSSKRAGIPVGERPSGLSREKIAGIDFAELAFCPTYMDLGQETVMLQKIEQELLHRLRFLEGVHGRLSAKLDGATSECCNVAV